MVTNIDREAFLQKEREDSAVCAKRIGLLFDEGTFTELDAYMKSGEFPAEVVTGYGYIGGAPIYAFLQNSQVRGGAMGPAHGAKIKRIYELAAKTGLPVVGVYDSKGAYISEGLDALAAYGELMLSANNLSGVVPQISLILGNCAGSGAMMAVSADFVVIAKGAKLFITPGDENTAESAAKNGTAHIYAQTEEAAIENVKTLISMLPLNNLEAVPSAEASDPSGGAEVSVLDNIIDYGSKTVLSPEFGEGAGTVLARLMGITCGIIDYQGESGVIAPDACVKAARFMRICDSFSIPVISLIDAERFGGAQCAEVRDAAMLAHAYAEATTVKISVITGRACGAVFTALAGRGANTDAVFSLPDAQISIMPPSAAAVILMGERRSGGETVDDLAAEYARRYATPENAAASGYVDDIVSKEALRIRLFTALEMLSGKRVTGMNRKHSNMPM